MFNRNGEQNYSSVPLLVLYIFSFPNPKSPGNVSKWMRRKRKRTRIRMYYILRTLKFCITFKINECISSITWTLPKCILYALIFPFVIGTLSLLIIFICTYIALILCKRELIFTTLEIIPFQFQISLYPFYPVFDLITLVYSLIRLWINSRSQ